MTNSIRVVLADSHLIVGQAVERLLRDRYRHVELVHTGADLLATVARIRPDVVVSEIALDGLSGFEVLRKARAIGVAAPFVFLTAYSGLVGRALREGGSGYVVKSSPVGVLFKAIDATLEGRVYFPTMPARSRPEPSPVHITATQRRILNEVARGKKTRQVAEALGVRIRTVESHKYALMSALNVHTTLDLVLLAGREGWLEEVIVEETQRPAARTTRAISPQRGRLARSRADAARASKR